MAIEKRIKELDLIITKLETDIKNSELTSKDFSNFQQYAKKLMAHSVKLLIGEPNIHKKQALFSLVFYATPNYEEVVNGTPQLTVMFELSKLKEIPICQMVAPTSYGLNSHDSRRQSTTASGERQSVFEFSFHYPDSWRNAKAALVKLLFDTK